MEPSVCNGAYDDLESLRKKDLTDVRGPADRHDHRSPAMAGRAASFGYRISIGNAEEKDEVSSLSAPSGSCGPMKTMHPLSGHLTLLHPAGISPFSTPRQVPNPNYSESHVVLHQETLNPISMES